MKPARLLLRLLLAHHIEGTCLFSTPRQLAARAIGHIVEHIAVVASLRDPAATIERARHREADAVERARSSAVARGLVRGVAGRRERRALEAPRVVQGFAEYTGSSQNHHGDDR